MPNSLQPHGLQHARLPCPSLPPSLLRHYILTKLNSPSMLFCFTHTFNQASLLYNKITSHHLLISWLNIFLSNEITRGGSLRKGGTQRKMSSRKRIIKDVGEKKKKGKENPRGWQFDSKLRNHSIQRKPRIEITIRVAAKSKLNLLDLLVYLM